MDYEINIEGGGDIEIFKDLPEDLKRLSKLPASCYTLGGEWGKVTFLHYRGKGFTLSFNDYRMKRDIILRANSGMAILELNVAMANPIKGVWDGIEQPTLSRRHFNLRHTPSVKTRAFFDANKPYSSFDIYFEKPYLQRLSKNFPVLAEFLNKVERKEPAVLSNFDYTCSKSMMAAIKFIENNVYSVQSQQWMIESKVKEILLAALDTLAEEPPDKEIIIHAVEEEALYGLKEFIEKELDNTPSLEEFCRRSAMSENRLAKGFRQLFGVTPHEYHIAMRIEEAKRLLLDTDNPVWEVARAVGYNRATSFCNEFKKLTGFQPGVYRKLGPKRKSY